MGSGGPGHTHIPSVHTDEICDYFGVKIAMYFAWLGFYTSAMVYPAVFGSILYTFTESDQVCRGRRWGQPRHVGGWGGPISRAAPSPISCCTASQPSALGSELLGSPGLLWLWGGGRGATPLLSPRRPARTSAVWCLPSSTSSGPRCSWRSGSAAGQSLPTSGGRWTPPQSPSRSPGPSSG